MPSDSFTIIPAEDDNPKAVVLLFGWMGSQMRHLNKYAAIYNRLGCTTIAGVAATVDIMTANQTALDDMALSAARHAATVLRQRDHEKNIPLILHAFSNGGGLVVEHLEMLIAQSNSNEDLQICQERLQVELFDSAPAFMHISSGVNAIGSAVPNVAARWFVTGLFVTFAMMDVFITTVFRRPNRREQYWSHMLNSRAVSKQVYLFSAADTITDSVKLDELIAYRKALGIHVEVHKFLDSGHVAHYRKHPKEYEGAIANVLANL